MNTRLLSVTFGGHPAVYLMHFEQGQMARRCWISSVHPEKNIERLAPEYFLKLPDDRADFLSNKRIVLSMTLLDPFNRAI